MEAITVRFLKANLRFTVSLGVQTLRARRLAGRGHLDVG